MTEASSKVIDKVAELTGHARGDVRAERPLRELVQDSFALVEIVIELQDAFGIQVSQADFARVVTVGDLLALFEERLAAAAPAR